MQSLSPTKEHMNSMMISKRQSVITVATRGNIFTNNVFYVFYMLDAFIVTYEVIRCFITP